LLTFLVNATWQVALIGAGAALANWSLQNVAARYRHSLWVAALVLAISFPILSCSYVIRQKVAAVSPTFQPIVITRIIGAEVDPGELSGLSRSTPLRRDGAPISPLHINSKLATAMIVFFLLFFSYRGLNLWRAWRTTRAIICSAYEPEFSDSVRAIITKCQRTTRQTRVRVVCSDRVPVPVTVGAFRRLIVLPTRLFDETDDQILLSAIGHEFIHCARRDYLINLICELIYLPLSFHPAAALIRRRTKQSRELACDESVVTTLLSPESYARSLVRLISAAPITGHLIVDTTIGIAESDHLEMRIMSLIRNSKSTPRRSVFLGFAAFLLLAAPCATAASFALKVDVYPGAPLGLSQAKVQEPEADNNKNKTRAELSEQVEQSRQDQSDPKLRQELLQQLQKNYGQDDERLKQERERLSQLLDKYPGDSAEMREAARKFAEMSDEYQKQIAAANQQLDRKAKLIHKVEPQYPDDARARGIEGTVRLGMTVDHDGLPQNIQVKKSLDPSLDKAAIEAVRQWRFEPALKDGQPVSMWVEVEVFFSPDAGRMAEQTEERIRNQENALLDRARSQQQELEERTKAQDKEAYERANTQYRELLDRSKAVDDEVREHTDESELRAKIRKLNEDAEEKSRGAGLEAAKWAKISMTQAIQIATSKYPGAVLQARLFGEREDKVFYQVMIANGDDITYVWVNAVDGQIAKTETAKRRHD